ncbi:hypothetical protein D9619_009365 [Psilocybe cf. subviscida]|uniref:Extracellular serine-rich protein n=1 Tax=Psilocybe cf. subviscida TaxID=2480587 RepID=A0A8H5BUL5_9AGAR|nr:hypothetical protein D9619_009365 [Psilocybe cf. subviscida]
MGLVFDLGLGSVFPPVSRCSHPQLRTRTIHAASPMKYWTSASLSSALFVASLVHAQTTHTVTVGKLGSFYDPPTLSAGLNDTIIFTFLGPVHTVTQTSFNTPCVQLPGGFNSGAAGVGVTPPLNVPPTWTLKITNDSEPIWFFCEISTPTSHCAAGMVGAINPPSQQAFDQFVAAAKAVSGTPSPVVTVDLTGSGAIATASPSAPANSSVIGSITTSLPVSSLSSSIAPTSISTTSTVPTPPPVAGHGTKTHLGAIIGGVIGGLIGGLLIIGALIWCLRHRKSKARRDSTDDSRFFRYHVPVRTPSDAFRAAKANENSQFSGGTPPQTNENLVTRDSSPDLARPLSPLRRGQFAAPTPINLAIPTTPAVNPPTTATDSTAVNAGAAPGVPVSNIDMHSFANEVAQVIMRSTSGNTLNAQRRANEDNGAYPRPQSMRIANPSAGGPPTTNLLDPPAYRRQAGGGNSPALEKARLPRD